MTSIKLMPGTQFPAIDLPTVGGGKISLNTPQTGFDWQLVIVYRGQHCPLCTRYLTEAETLRKEFQKLGIDIIAVSADSESQATIHKEKMTISFPIAYGLSIQQMQQLGLYISSPRSEQETDHPFSEPGLFVINEKGQVQILDMSNGPFVRPELKTLLAGLAFIRNPENNYPIRGTFR